MTAAKCQGIVEPETLDRLLDVAERARVWFDNHVKGSPYNGMHDDILIARALTSALNAVAKDQAR